MLKKHLTDNSFFRILIVFLTTLIAYGQTLLMYFWQDDFALIFKLQHPVEPAGSFGPGIIGNGAYKYLVTPYAALYPILGTNAFLYFLVGLLSYFVVIYCFYLVAKTIFEDKKDYISAYVATVIFASGYIGSDIMFRVINSWQTNIGLVLALISLKYFLSLIKEQSNRKQIVNYIISLGFYFFATEFVYIRSHSLIFVYLAIELIYLLKKINLKGLIKSVLRQLPFWAIFYFRYVRDIPSGEGGLNGFFNAIFSVKLE